MMIATMDFTKGFALQLHFHLDGTISEALWFWCDLPFGRARVGVA